MDKETFLRLQYLRMINSNDFVAEVWRSSINRFLADMWDRTPNNALERFLAPIEPSLGFTPDNVEWQFPKIRKRPSSRNSYPGVQSTERTTKLERLENERAARAAAKEAKRQAIVNEFAKWEAIRAQKR